MSLPISGSNSNLIFSRPPPPPSPPFLTRPPPPPPSLPSLHHSKIIPFPDDKSFLPPLPFLDTVFDLTTLSLIVAVLLLSLLSLCFIFHLRFKSRTSRPLLQNFNSHWTVRLVLVSLIAFWALNELLRLPFFRRHYLYPYLPSLFLSHQANLCKVHVVLSLGFFEPGFLIILLFLVKVSIKRRNSHNRWALAFLFAACFPILLLQIIVVFFLPVQVIPLPEIFKRSSILLRDEFDKETILCTYPLLSTLVFAAFGIAYSLGLLLSCWKVVSLVINKSLRVRIYALACTILVSLSIQIVFLGLSVLWGPGETAYRGVVLVIFLSVLSCAAVGECILVISPIADTLSAGGDCCQWYPIGRSPRAVDKAEVVDGCE